MDQHVREQEATVDDKQKKGQSFAQAEDIAGADGKSEAPQDEKPSGENAIESEGDGTLSLGRDSLELIFRYALASESTMKSAGTFFKRVFALRDTFARDAIVRVVKRFSMARFAGIIQLIRGQETAIVTVQQFVWMVRWDMLRVDVFDLSSVSVTGCNYLTRHSDIFKFREIKYTANGRHVGGFQVPQEDQVSSELALALVKNSVDCLKVLDGLSLWRLEEPLPALRLDRFVFVADLSPNNLSNPLNKLSHCTIGVFEYRCRGLYDFRLDRLLNIRAEEIVLTTRGGPSFSSLPCGASNVHVRRVRFRIYYTELSAAFFETLCRFFPNLAEIDLHMMEFTAYSWQPTTHDGWTSHNVRWYFGVVQKFSQALASAQGTFPMQLNVHMPFGRANGPEAPEATEKALELGFNREDVNGSSIFKRQAEVAKGRIVTTAWIVQ